LIRARVGQLWAGLGLWLRGPAARRWLTVLFVLASAGVLAWMLLSNASSLASFSWQIRWWAVAAAVGAYAVALLLAVWAWSQVMAEVAGPQPFRRHLRIYCLTLAAARIPGAPWHLAGRAVLYNQHGIAKRLTTLAAGWEVLLIAAGGLLVGVLILPQTHDRLPVPGWILLLSAAIILIALHPEVRQRLLRWVSRQEVMTPTNPWRTPLLILVYGAIWVAGGSVLFLAIASIYPVHLAVLPYVIGAWAFSGTISMITVLSPSGIGLRDVTLSFLLGFVLPPGPAVVVALYVRVLVTILEVVAALLAYRLSVK
jgi:hypothetical protein